MKRLFGRYVFKMVQWNVHDGTNNGGGIRLRSTVSRCFAGADGITEAMQVGNFGLAINS